MLEVIVALAIAALAFGYAYPAISESLNRLRFDRDGAAAVAVAETLLDRVGYDLPLQPGSQAGTADNGMAWQLAIAPYEAQRPLPQSGVTGLQVAVTVRWRDGTLSREVQLQTVRVARDTGGR
ncbi:hypothetical protein ACFOGJ_13335 [Marinibaculum pumilum]|uniref:General secretion pathway protein GspI n=1 Tax=Marinibaculum pumilum TaxID=1766165 RepID=A0ABV7L0U9_9PROT